MQQHGGLPKFGPSIKQDGLAPKAAAEEILRKPGTADELSRAEDRFFGKRIVERNRNHGVPYRIGRACAIVHRFRGRSSTLSYGNELTR